MSLQKSNYLENAVVNHVLRNTPLTSPTTVYLALFTSDPGEAGSGTEVSGGSYARQSVAFAAPSDGVVTNSGLVTFPAATAGWGTVTHVAIFDALTSGNMLYYGPMSVSKLVSIGDVVTVAVGQLSVTET